MTEFLYALLSVIVVSLISLIGVFTLSMKEKKLKKYLLVLVAFAAGTLLSAAFLDLLPEASESLGDEVFLYVLLGILFFFILEGFIHWHHCMKEECEVYPKSVGIVNLIGDGFHNFLDGVIIAAAYLVSIPTGIAATIAIIFHEIPQEIGDYAVLIHTGFEKKKALMYNFGSALISIFGMIVSFFFLQSFSNYLPYILAIAGGGFIYIALTDLFPEIGKSRDLKKLILQTVFVLLGAFVIYYVTGLFHHMH